MTVNVDSLAPASNGFEPTILIKLVENGYIVVSDVPALSDKGEIVIDSKVHIFPRDVHVIKYIRELMPILESLPK